MPPTATLRVDQLKKSYQRRVIVHDCSFSMHSGDILGLLGPNGAGKTTSFYMIVGLIQSEQGRLMLNDQDITRYPMHKRATLGLSYLPQEPSIFRRLSVQDNIMAILQLDRTAHRKERKERLESLLTQFNLTHLRHTLGLRLSGGERRRVEIARALCLRPKFILLDEPFAGVDPISIAELKECIHQLSQNNIGVLITDHNVRETLDICHQACILNQGKIIATGSPDYILEHDVVKSSYLGTDFKR